MSVTINGSGQAIVQLQTVALATQFSSTSTSFTDVTGLSVSITPTNSSNKILVLFSINGASDDHSGVRLTRNGTAIAVGTPTGSQTASTTADFYFTSNSAQVWNQGMNFLDSPATTSAVTYKLQMRTESGTFTINSNSANLNASYTMNGISTITVMEISGT
jgi:hypothetical protein